MELSESKVAVNFHAVVHFPHFIVLLIGFDARNAAIGV